MSVALAETNKADTKPQNLLEIKSSALLPPGNLKEKAGLPSRCREGWEPGGRHCLARAVRPLHEGMDRGGVFCQDSISLDCQGAHSHSRSPSRVQLSWAGSWLSHTLSNVTLDTVFTDLRSPPVQWKL